MTMELSKEAVVMLDLIVYDIDPGDADIPIGCIIKTQPIGSFPRDHLTVERCDQLEGNPLIGWSEELFGNIVALKFRNGVVMKNPIQILIPYPHTRKNPSKTEVIKMQDFGSKDWLEKECFEVNNVEVCKEYRFLQTSMDTPTDCKMAVVSRLKRETFTASSPHALRVTSSVDPRLTFVFKQALLKKPLTFELEYLPVDLTTIQEVKRRHPKETKRLLGCSGIVTIKDLNIYISITLPIHPPPSANRISRPSTGMDYYPPQPIVTGADSRSRPKTANPIASFFSLINYSKEDVIEDRLALMLFQSDENTKKGSWYISRMVNFSETRRKDLVTIDLERPIPTKFIVLRYKNDGAKNKGYRYGDGDDYGYGGDGDDDDDEMVLRAMVESIEQTLMLKSVHFLLRQHEENPHKVVVEISGHLKLERTLKKLADDGYSHGPPVTPPILLREGQEVGLKFRTNIGGIKVDDKTATKSGMKEGEEKETTSDKRPPSTGCANGQIFDLRTDGHLVQKFPGQHDESARSIRMVFNSHLRSQVRLDMYVVDKYSQKALDCYRGFVQIFTKIDPSISDKPSGRDHKLSYGKSSWQVRDSVQEDLKEGGGGGGEPVEDETKMEEVETTSDDQFHKQSSFAQVDLDTVKQFAYLENKKFYANMKLLCELLVDLPKPTEDPPKFVIKRTPFIIRPDGIMDHPLLENLAKQIGKEWIQLAEQLNVRRIRIDAILEDSSNEKAALDVLMSWIKRMPRCANKVEILSKAFQACGRKDLSRHLIQKNEEFRRRLPMFNKESVLAGSIRLIGRYAYLVYDWHLLCRRFGFSDDFIDSIQSKYPDARERCRRILTKWQENGIDSGVDVVTSLIKILRDAKCYQLAEIFQKEYGN